MHFAYASQVINHPEEVAIACNKLLTFRALKEANISTPEYKLYKEDALFWINEGHKVFCRTKLTAHSGQGIIIASTPEELVEAPLYTKYTKCKYEYRVHVMNGQIIDFVQKKKRDGIEANPHIRSHDYGWIFAREGVELPECVKSAA
ncbi:MAG: hypothetical protein NUV97_00030, partial [archaeon]|nr:hypothetical protein [archaeon]